MHRKPAGCERHQIKSHGTISQGRTPGRQGDPGAAKAIPLIEGDGFEGDIQADASLHLNHRQDLSAQGHEIDLGLPSLEAKPEDPVAPGHEPKRGEHLAPPAGQPRRGPSPGAIGHREGSPDLRSIARR